MSGERLGLSADRDRCPAPVLPTWAPKLRRPIRPRGRRYRGSTSGDRYRGSQALSAQGGRGAIGRATGAQRRPRPVPRAGASNLGAQVAPADPAKGAPVSGEHQRGPVSGQYPAPSALGGQDDVGRAAQGSAPTVSRRRVPVLPTLGAQAAPADSGRGADIGGAPGETGIGAIPGAVRAGRAGRCRASDSGSAPTATGASNLGAKLRRPIRPGGRRYRGSTSGDRYRGSQALSAQGGRGAIGRAAQGSAPTATGAPRRCSSNLGAQAAPAVRPRPAWYNEQLDAIM